MEGRLSSRSYESNGQTKFSMEINLTDIQFLGNKDREPVAAGADVMDNVDAPDDLPF